MKKINDFLSGCEKFVAHFPALYGFLKKCKVAYQRVKYFCFRVLRIDRKIIYDRSFYDKNLEMNIPIAKALTRVLIDNFHPGSVADVGCGNAEFLREFQKEGVFIKGYEGSPSAFEKVLVDKRFIELFDLRNAIIPSQKYDLALCFEVAEHIEKKFSGQLVKNLIVLSDTVAFTAAPPGQGGHFHINEQPRDFWIALFRKQGFEFQESLSRKIQDEMKNAGVLWWYYKNIMIFKRNTQIVK